MSIKTTKKSVIANYPTILCVGYCDLQHLLADITPIAHTERREGWAANIYDLGRGTAICTGYAPFGNICPSKDICAKYDSLAKIVVKQGYYVMQQQLPELRKDFLREAFK